MASSALAALLPPCAIDCITETCSIADLACICRAGYYGNEETRSRCIVDACGFPASLAVRNRTATACGAPARDESGYFNAVELVLFALSTAVILARLVFKQFFSKHRRLAVDDCLMIGISLAGIPCLGIMVGGLKTHGLGRDAWTLSVDDVALFVFYFYIVEILYLVLISLVRLTFTLFYLDIFSERPVRRLLWATLGFHAACGLAFVAKAIFQCWPIDYNWSRYSRGAEHRDDGHCVHVLASSWANAALGVAADLWLLAIPLTQIKRLNLHWKKKVGATFMFLAGTIGTIISILRLRSIFQFSNTTNPTWDHFGIVWWSSIEVHVGMIGSCMPALRLIFLYIWPRLFGVGPGQPSKSTLRRRRAGRLHLESTTSNDSCLADLDKTDTAASDQVHDAAARDLERGSFPQEHDAGRVGGLTELQLVESKPLTRHERHSV